MEYNLGKFRVVVTSDEVSDAVFLSQKHGATIVEADNVESDTTPADGIIVREGGEPGGVYTADCLPLVLVAERFAVALHVSRKSLVVGILESAREVFKGEKPTHIFIGPHACVEHLTYEYNGDEIKALRQKFPQAVLTRNGLTYISIEEVVLSFLKNWFFDIPDIMQDGRCTVENPDLFSWRRHSAEGKPFETLGRIKTVVYPS